LILQALCRLAEREGLLLDYEPRRVAWIVDVSSGGRLVGIRATRETPPSTAGKKIRPQAKRFWIPRQPTGRSGTKAPACFLVDNAKYVFGLATKGKSIKPDDAAEKRGWFRDLVNDCLSKTKDEAVVAVSQLLHKIADGRVTVSLDDECRPEDLFAFSYSPDAGLLVHERPGVREYWAELRERERGDSGGGVFTCLVTGKNFANPALFPLVEGVPGASPTRIGLVSFNKVAFESYGLQGNENAPISQGAAETAATALNRLLADGYLDPRQPGQTLPSRSLRLSADTVVCYWAAEASADEFCSVFAGLLEANPEKVKELYRSVWSGKRPEIDDQSAFYALTLSGSQGRAIVRDWFEATVAKVAQNLSRHFADLQMVRITPKPRERDLPPQFALSALLKSLAVDGDSEKIPPPLVAELVGAALLGNSYPLSILQRAVERSRAEIGKNEWLDLARRDARAALIKAVLNRRRRFAAGVTYEEVTPDMNPENRSEGYALGLLMAVLERLQQEAQGNVNASVVDRYFSGASVNPKTVFARLLKNARHHVSKATAEGSGGLVIVLERIIDELSERFDPNRNGFPAFLNLEQQGLFLLGYHQMRKWLWMTREERAEWEKGHPNASPAFIRKPGKE
jgi:CRISPR-associated protein Csd1